MPGHPRPPLTVAVEGDWPDLDDAVRFLTPGGSGVWDGVAFRPLRAASDPDLLVVLSRPLRPIAVRLPPERVWFAIGEPPTVRHRVLHVGQGRGTVVLTCDRSVAEDPVLAAERTYLLEPPVVRTWQVRRSIEALEAMDAVEKSRDLSWITSNLQRLDGHRRRLAFLGRLQGALPFDLFGRGFRPVEDKWDALAPYRYAIAFESKVAPGYFTEKLMDCFVALAMPIYVGAPDIERYLPAEAMVRIDPDDPDVVPSIREAVRSDRWRRAGEALREARRRVLHERNMFARLAALIRDRVGTAAVPSTATTDLRPLVPPAGRTAGR